MSVWPRRESTVYGRRAPVCAFWCCFCIVLTGRRSLLRRRNWDLIPFTQLRVFFARVLCLYRFTEDFANLRLCDAIGRVVSPPPSPLPSPPVLSSLSTSPHDPRHRRPPGLPSVIFVNSWIRIVVAGLVSQLFLKARRQPNRGHKGRT